MKKFYLVFMPDRYTAPCQEAVRYNYTKAKQVAETLAKRYPNERVLILDAIEHVIYCPTPEFNWNKTEV